LLLPSLLILISCTIEDKEWDIEFNPVFKFYPVSNEDYIILPSRDEGTNCIISVNKKNGEQKWKLCDTLFDEIYYNSEIPVIAGKLILPLRNKTVAIEINHGNVLWIIEHKGRVDSSIFTDGQYVFRTMVENETTVQFIIIKSHSGKIEDKIDISTSTTMNSIFRSPKKMILGDSAFLLSAFIEYFPLKKTNSYFVQKLLENNDSLADCTRYSLFPENKTGKGATQAPIIKRHSSFWSIENEIMCFDHKEMIEKWRIKLAHGLFTSRMLLNPKSLLIPCEDEYLYSLDLENGAILWKTRTSGTPSKLFSNHNFIQLIGGSTQKIYVLSSMDGHVLNKFYLKKNKKLERVCYFDNDFCIISDGNRWMKANFNDDSKWIDMETDDNKQ